MRALTISVIGVLVIGVALFLAGPSFLFPVPGAGMTTVQQVNESRDLDQYLAEHEAKFSGEIRPGESKEIKWFNPLAHQRTHFSIVYLHGWSASRLDTFPTLDILAKQLHANVFFSRLTAHGLNGSQRFESLTMQDLIEDGREAMAIGRKIGERVILVGISTGATLAVDEAFEYRTGNEPAALVLLSPNFMPIKSEVRFLTGPFGRWIARALLGPLYSFRLENPEQGKIWTATYPSVGLVAMADLVNYTNSLDLSQIRIPTLLLYTHLDEVVSVASMQLKFAQLGSVTKDMQDLPLSTRHALVGDMFGKAASAPAANTIVDFVNKIELR